MDNFYGRTSELSEIYKVLDRTKQQNILIYGRRRIGKSFLIRKAIEKYDCKKIFYQCKNISIEKTIEQLTETVRQTFNNKFISFHDIEEAFDFIFSQNDVIFVLDEYSFLQQRVEGLDSIIQQKIDEYKFSSNIKLIISGSAIDIMRKIVDYDNPLFGRFNLVINLKEHNYLESSLYYKLYSNEDKVLLYSVFGGEPYYNSLIDPTKTVVENIIELAIKENSQLEMNIMATIKNEISKIACANEVLTALALGRKKNNEIATFAYVDSASMNNALKKLISLDIVEKVKPINVVGDKKALYSIKSNSIRFYYRYVYMLTGERDSMNARSFFDKFVANDFKTQFVPKVFEDVAKQFLIQRNKIGLMDPLFSRIGTYYFDDSKNKKNGQFDVVTLDENGYIFYEVKFTNDPIGTSVLNEEIKQLANLGLNYYKLGFISKTGSTLEPEKYNLFSLADIYALQTVIKE